jgi:hypothetical protein
METPLDPADAGLGQIFSNITENAFITRLTFAAGSTLATIFAPYLHVLMAVLPYRTFVARRWLEREREREQGGSIVMSAQSKKKNCKNK